MRCNRRRRLDRHLRAITRNFDINRTLGTFGYIQDPLQFAVCSIGIVEYGLGNSDFLEHPKLCAKFPYAMVQ
jgi:hypothetical protein